MKRFLCSLILLWTLCGGAYGATNLQPSAGQAPTNATLTWTNNEPTPPNSYQIYVIQGAAPLYGTPDIVSVGTLGCAQTGQTCSYPVPQPLTAGELVAWQVTPIYNSEPGVYNWSPMATFYAADPVGSEWLGSPFPLNTMDDTPCSQWTFVSDYPGQTRLVFFVNTGTGVGVGVLPESNGSNHVWTTLDVSDLVPLAARAMMVQYMTVYSASCNASGGDVCDIVGFQTRRTGSTMQTAGIWYSSSPRHFGTAVVLLNQGKFDLMWGDIADDNINVKQINGSTVTGEEVAGRLIGYCQ